MVSGTIDSFREEASSGGAILSFREAPNPRIQSQL
jgi:hypothetical protein